MKTAHIASAALVGAFVVSTALAIEPSNTTVFNCAAPGAVSSKFAYCAANITSGTTAAALGSVNIDPRKQITISFRSSVATSPTINYRLNGTTVYSQTVSASTTPQTTGFLVPFFDNILISQSQPALISATNAISMTIIENAPAGQ